MMGQELSGLDIKELGNLENRLERSLKGVRMKKVSSFKVKNQSKPKLAHPLYLEIIDPFHATCLSLT